MKEFAVFGKYKVFLMGAEKMFGLYPIMRDDAGKIIWGSTFDNM